MIFYHTNLIKRMLIYNLQTKFLLIIVNIVYKRYVLKYFDFYTIRPSTANIFNTDSSYVPIRTFSTTLRQSMDDILYRYLSIILIMIVYRNIVHFFVRYSVPTFDYVAHPVLNSKSDKKNQHTFEMILDK